MANMEKTAAELDSVAWLSADVQLIHTIKRIM
jgi:hypothetical protein